MVITEITGETALVRFELSELVPSDFDDAGYPIGAHDYDLGRGWVEREWPLNEALDAVHASDVRFPSEGR